MKLAQFRNTQFDYIGVWEKTPISEGWVQVSGWLEVEFPPLSAAEQNVSAQLIALAARQKAFEDTFRRQRKALEEERQALQKAAAA